MALFTGIVGGLGDANAVTCRKADGTTRVSDTGSCNIGERQVDPGSLPPPSSVPPRAGEPTIAVAPSGPGPVSPVAAAEPPIATAEPPPATLPAEASPDGNWGFLGTLNGKTVYFYRIDPFFRGEFSFAHTFGWVVPGHEMRIAQRRGPNTVNLNVKLVDGAIHAFSGNNIHIPITSGPDGYSYTAGGHTVEYKLDSLGRLLNSDATYVGFVAEAPAGAQQLEEYGRIAKELAESNIIGSSGAIETDWGLLAKYAGRGFTGFRSVSDPNFHQIIGGIDLQWIEFGRILQVNYDIPTGSRRCLFTRSAQKALVRTCRNGGFIHVDEVEIGANASIVIIESRADGTRLEQLLMDSDNYQLLYLERILGRSETDITTVGIYDFYDSLVHAAEIQSRSTGWAQPSPAPSYDSYAGYEEEDEFDPYADDPNAGVNFWLKQIEDITADSYAEADRYQRQLDAMARGEYPPGVPQPQVQSSPDYGDPYADARAALAREQAIAEEFARGQQEQEVARLAQAGSGSGAARDRSDGVRANPYGGGDAGSASTYSDPNRCIGQPMQVRNPNCKDGTAFEVTNACEQTVDVRICIRTIQGKWDCGTSWGVRPGAKMGYPSCFGTSDVFVSARSTGSNAPLASPP